MTFGLRTGGIWGASLGVARAIVCRRQRTFIECVLFLSSRLKLAATELRHATATSLALIRASEQVGPALSAKNRQAVILPAGQVRMAGRNLMQVLKAIHCGQAKRIEDTEPVGLGFHQMVAAIDHELTEMTVAQGLKLRCAASLSLPAEPDEERLLHEPFGPDRLVARTDSVHRAECRGRP